MPLAEEVLREAERSLKASGRIEHPHAGKELFDAEQLLSFVLKAELSPETEVSAHQLARFRQLLDRRSNGEPAAYLTGRARFRNLPLRVGPGAFIPRQSSEFLAEQAIRRLRRRRPPVSLDLATGVGAVALSVAAALPRARVFGVDVSARAVALARRNAKDLGLRNARFFVGDLFAPLPGTLRGTLDVITIHPPYVPRAEVRTLPGEIRSFEPREALTDYSPTGLRLTSRVVQESLQWLKRGGWLLIEVSPDVSRAVGTLLRRAGYRDVRSTRGSVPVSRVVTGRM